MNNSFQRFFQQLIPFAILGLMVFVGMALFVLFSYFLLWGFIIAGIFWLIAMFKGFFKVKEQKKEQHGRIIEHDSKDK